MSLYLPATLGPLVRSAADDVGRYAMNGVQVTDPGNGTFRCVVTDGRNLLVARGVCPERGRLRDGPSDYQPTVIVPSPAWNEAFRKHKALSVWTPRTQKEPPVAIDWPADKRLQLTTGDRSLRCEPVDGRFPEWTNVLPKGNPVFSINVNPEMLAELLLTFSRLLPEDRKRVTLAFWKADSPMAVVTKDNTGLCLDALLMPLTPTPEEEAELRRKQEQPKCRSCGQPCDESSSCGCGEEEEEEPTSRPATQEEIEAAQEEEEVEDA